MGRWDTHTVLAPSGAYPGHIHEACRERGLEILKQARTETDEILKQVQNDRKTKKLLFVSLQDQDCIIRSPTGPLLSFRIVFYYMCLCVLRVSVANHLTQLSFPRGDISLSFLTIGGKTSTTCSMSSAVFPWPRLNLIELRATSVGIPRARST